MATISRPDEAMRTTPWPAYLDELQEQMEELYQARQPNSGHFCGCCYARRRGESVACHVCGGRFADVGEAGHVPYAVLELYWGKRRREGLVVNTLAFTGLFLSVVLSGLLVYLLPGWWRLSAVAMLLVGSYYLANILGGWVGGAIGYGWGARVRARRWEEFVERRAAGAADLR